MSKKGTLLLKKKIVQNARALLHLWKKYVILNMSGKFNIHSVSEIVNVNGKIMEEQARKKESNFEKIAF